MWPAHHWRVAAAAIAATLASGGPGLAEPLAMSDPRDFPAPIFQQILPESATPQQPLPQATEPETQSAVVPERLRRQVVAYGTREAPGTIVIDTPHTYLYYVLGGGRAVRYGIGVGREGFTWSGVKNIDRKVEWPDWHPPAEMIARQPYLPRFMAGGPGNPLGARAMYLGGSLYRIHGTSDPSSIGKHVSSGCIRMLNADAIDLYDRAPLGAKVVVLPDNGHRARPDVARQRSPVHLRERVSQVIEPASAPQRPPAAVSGAYDSPLYSGSSASRIY
ncbi:MAG: L,D-transpeptidase [Xanthobacteraceae bacterium]